jgi:hypothetical protein
MNRKKGNREYYTLKKIEEEFVDISGSVRGPMISPSLGLRSDLPVRHPLYFSPVFQPSPLNSEYIYNTPFCMTGVL